MEVLCWSNIIEGVQNEFKESAVICSFPLFEAFDNFLFDNTIDLAIRENKIILMLIDWIQNATLVDFNVRLFSGNLLAYCIDQRTRKEMFSSNLSSRIKLVVNYFKIFEEIFAEQFVNKKEEIEAKLKDFVKIFKYNDLNLWSVKQSTQKVHTQLFRIIKQFKVFLFLNLVVSYFLFYLQIIGYYYFLFRIFVVNLLLA